ncbi:helix-turn-helix domain-containing protein [Oscillibacter valericigenes]|uniref:helix-turn-helix domain-containing protein n=1 Tax=Oscillibacter valericigenes TaxID=351091 RepID=UPI002E22478A
MIWLYFRRIHDLREDQDIKQKAVAEYLGMDPTVYRRYEKGVRSVPVDVVIKLADYYKVSTDYLLGRTDDPTPPQKSK